MSELGVTFTRPYNKISKLPRIISYTTYQRTLPGNKQAPLQESEFRIKQEFLYVAADKNPDRGRTNISNQTKSKEMYQQTFRISKSSYFVLAPNLHKWKDAVNHPEH